MFSVFNEIRHFKQIVNARTLKRKSIISNLKLKKINKSKLNHDCETFGRIAIFENQ